MGVAMCSASRFWCADDQGVRSYMYPFLVNIRVALADGTTKVAQTLVYARNPNDARLLLQAMYGRENVLSIPIRMPEGM